jgi:hypothetical protein
LGESAAPTFDEELAKLDIGPLFTGLVEGPAWYRTDRPATLTIIALVFFVVLPAIALSGLALSVRRERLSRPPQTRVPPLVGLDYKTAETTLHNSKLNIRVLAHRYDPPVEPGRVLFQTPQVGESVDCGTVVGIVISRDGGIDKRSSR